MTSRILLLLGVTVLSMCLDASPGTAQSFVPIFDKRYVRTAGAPVAVSDTFAACDPNGSFRLVVVNGPGAQNEIATDPLSSGSVTVNGVEVIRESDLNKNVTRLERALTGIGSSNRLDVSIRSGPSGALQVSVEAAQACGLRITSPASGAVLRQGMVVVRGTLPSQPGVDLGVTVNGWPALVEGTQFAGSFYLEPTVTALVVEANGFVGTQARETIAVSVVPAGEEPFSLRANRPGGGAPFTADLRLSWTRQFTHVALDADGDGTIDAQSTSLDRFSFTYTRPGVYVPVARVTDQAGVVHTVTAVVHVMDPVARDRQLQAVWNGLKDALRAGDVIGAVRYLYSRSRNSYEAQLSRLSPTTLANIDQQLMPIRLVELGYGGAEYEMLRQDDGQTRSFAVWFNLDMDGLWRLRRF